MKYLGTKTFERVDTNKQTNILPTNSGIQDSMRVRSSNRRKKLLLLILFASTPDRPLLDWGSGSQQKERPKPLGGGSACFEQQQQENRPLRGQGFFRKSTPLVQSRGPSVQASFGCPGHPPFFFPLPKSEIYPNRGWGWGCLETCLEWRRV